MNTRITKLTLHGFKSFRKKVSIPIFPRFNVFCGANGTGKSNLVDAICFVFGKTSSKSLRAGRLKELIYHGNGNVLPSDYASVTIWLDNSSGIFPFETPEVSIKRKINKKGVSVYKINGKTVTREKVLELLSTARIHPDGFNIIMQGDITRIIEMSPQERKEIIDEISGIAEYDEKKAKAEKNLESVDLKLKEVEIIITERSERLYALEQDRNTALKYKDFTEKLETLRASLSHKKYMIGRESLEEVNKQVEKLEDEIKRLEDGIRSIEQGIESKEKIRQEITDKILIRSREAGIRSDIEDIKSRILRNKDKIESDQREIERITKMIEKLESLQGRKTGVLSRAVQTILDLNRKNVYGIVSDLVKVPSEYEIAIEVAGGYKLQNLVVDNAGTATELINYLKTEKIGRATFLPLNKIKPRSLADKYKPLLKKPGVVGILSKLIKFDQKYAPVVNYIFGDTVLVENLGVARQIGIGNIRMVTLDGDLAERSGAMIGGYYQKRGEVVPITAEIEEYERMKKDLEEEVNFLRLEIGQLNVKMEGLRKSQEKESKEVADLEVDRSRIDQELEHMRIERKEKFEQRLTLQNQINKLKIKAAKMEAELENLKLETEKYKKVEFIDERPEILELQINRTISMLNSLGLVNMRAIDEYDAYKKEFDELKEKYDKIRKERQAITEMIEKIEEKRKEVFYRCLRGIDRNFRKVYKELTGGTASIELEDQLNIESGLLIKATPARKRMMSIDAMSGGEKVITALAFLFAVQKYQPAPFYVLDEIDAALDKVNTKKIGDMIKRLSREDQFIVITHNDYTIKQGDRVYGVSIENGESKILGVELPGETAR